MRLVTSLEAAYILCTTRESIHKWVTTGILPSISIQDNGKRLIDLYGYLKSKGIDPTPYFEQLELMRRSKSDHSSNNKE